MTKKLSTIFKERKEESKRVLNKYPDRIPVICQKRNVNDDTPLIKKTKFLVPRELTVAQFMSVVRKKINLLSKNKSLNKKNFRFLIRFSGTEPVIRILVEGPKISEVKLLANKLEIKVRSLID